MSQKPSFLYTILSSYASNDHVAKVLIYIKKGVVLVYSSLKPCSLYVNIFVAQNLTLFSIDCLAKKTICVLIDISMQ